MPRRRFKRNKNKGYDTKSQYKEMVEKRKREEKAKEYAKTQKGVHYRNVAQQMTIEKNLPQYQKEMEIYKKITTTDKEKLKNKLEGDWDKIKQEKVSQHTNKLSQFADVQKKISALRGNNATKKNDNATKLAQRLADKWDKIDDEQQNIINDKLSQYSDHYDIKGTKNNIDLSLRSWKGRNYNADRHTKNLQISLMDKSNDLVEKLQKNSRDLRIAKSEIDPLDQNLDEHLAAANQILQHEEENVALEKSLTDELSRKDTDLSRDIDASFNSLNSTLLMSRKEPTMNYDPTEYSANQATLLDQFDQANIEKIEDEMRQLESKKFELQDQFDDVQSTISDLQNYQQNFVTKMNEVGEKNIELINTCLPLLKQRKALSENYQEKFSSYLDDPNNPHTYDVHQHRAAMEKEIKALDEKIKPMQQEINKYAKIEQEEMDVMQKEIDRVSKKTEHYNNQYKALKASLNNMDKRQSDYINSSKAVRKQMQNLENHDKNGLKTKFDEVSKEITRKASAKSSTSLKAPFYKSMQETLRENIKEINQLKKDVMNNMDKSTPLNHGAGNIVDQAYQQSLATKLQQDLHSYAEQTAGDKYSKQQNHQFADSVMNKLNASKDDPDQFINNYLVARAMLKTAKTQKMGLRDGFERIEKDVHRSVIARKTGAQKLMKSQFGMTKKIFTADSNKLDNQQQKTYQQDLRQSLNNFVDDKSQNMDQQIIQDNSATYNIYNQMQKAEKLAAHHSPRMHDIPDINPTKPIDINKQSTASAAVNDNNETSISHLGIMSYG